MKSSRSASTRERVQSAAVPSPGSTGRSSGRLKELLLVRSGDGIQPVDPARRGFGCGSDSAASRSEIARGASVHAMLLRLVLCAMGAPCSPGTSSLTGRREKATTIASTAPCAADAAKSDGDHVTPISVILRCALRGIRAHRRDVTPEHCERSSERARSDGSRFGFPRDTSECLGSALDPTCPARPRSASHAGLAECRASSRRRPRSGSCSCALPGEMDPRSGEEASDREVDPQPTPRWPGIREA